MSNHSADELGDRLRQSTVRQTELEAEVERLREERDHWRREAALWKDQLNEALRVDDRGA